MYGKQRKKKSNGKNIDEWNHADERGKNAQTEGGAAVRAQPAQFSAKRPMAARSRIVDKQQRRIVSIKEKNGCLSDDGNKIDGKGGKGYDKTEKGNFYTLENVGKKAGHGKIGVSVEVLAGIDLFGGGAEKDIAWSGQAVSQKKSEVKGDYSGDDKKQPAAYQPAAVLDPAENGVGCRSSRGEIAGELIDKTYRDQIADPGKTDRYQKKQKAPA